MAKRTVRLMDELEELGTDFDRVLAVVAHPDDVESGASAAVAVWTDLGKTVTYVLLTRGEAGIDSIEPERCGPLREAEQITAAACVGVSTVEFLGHADGTIEYNLALRRDIAGAIRRHRPELIVTLNHHDSWPGGWRNSPDHRNTGLAVLDAVGDASNRWIFREQLTDGLEPWKGVKRVLLAGSPAPTHAVAVEAGFERSVRSLQAHATYNTGLGWTPDDVRSLLTRNAETYRDRFGGRLCTAFEAIPFG
jgi:LmbE family N-acetylglucosaminyl deacetylase